MNGECVRHVHLHFPLDRRCYKLNFPKNPNRKEILILISYLNISPLSALEKQNTTIQMV